MRINKVAVIIFIVAIFSCKKTDSIINDSTIKLLIQQEWKLSKSEQKINSDPYIDNFGALPGCTQDDQYNFKADNTYERNEGATKCNSTDPQVIGQGTWQLASGETKIKIDGFESSIDKLDHNTFTISRSTITIPDTEYYRLTFVH